MILIDVRTPEEFELQHAEEAVNLPIDLLISGKMPNVASDEEIKLYCRSGSRSELAKSILENNGFTDVTNLGGLGEAI